MPFSAEIRNAPPKIRNLGLGGFAAVIAGFWTNGAILLNINCLHPRFGGRGKFGTGFVLRFFGYNALIAFLSSMVVGLTGSGPHGESVGCIRAGPGGPTKDGF